MTYRIEISPTAMADVEKIFRWLKVYSIDEAHRCVLCCYFIILTLEQFPKRCAMAAEAQYINLPVRQLLYKKQYRILFTVIEASEQDPNGQVQIHRVLRSAQDRLQDLSQLLGPS